MFRELIILIYYFSIHLNYIGRWLFSFDNQKKYKGPYLGDIWTSAEPGNFQTVQYMKNDDNQIDNDFTNFEIIPKPNEEDEVIPHLQ